MKRKLSLGLIAAMLLTLVGCGGKSEGSLEKFSEEQLTAAQQYAYAAMASYEIPDKEEDFKEARVMLTEDLAADLKGKVDIKEWDVSGVDAIVVAYLGDKVSDEAAKDAEGEDAKKDWSPVVFLVGGENKEVVYTRSLKATATAASASTEVAADDTETVKNAKKALAQAQLDAEKYLEEHAEELGEYPALLASKIAEKPDYVYSMEYFADLSGENASEGIYAGYYRNIYKAEYRLNQLTAENPKDEELIEADCLLFDEKISILNSMYDLQQSIANMDANSADQLTEYKAALETAKSNENYFFDETYNRAALANETANTYDNSLRQLKVYENALAVLEEIMASSDKDEREYLRSRVELENENLANYSNMYKTYVQCLVNLSNFEAENADAMAAYEAEVEAVKEAEGDGYEDSVDYIKVQLKYQDMLTSHEGFKNAIPLAKTDLDAMKSEFDAKLAELDEKEQGRLSDRAILEEKEAFFEYACKAEVEGSEYEVENGHWGYLHPDYAAYQNQHLKYYTSSSSYSGGSSYSKKKKNSYSNDSSSQKGAGGYDMPKEGESFSDYMQRVDPDLYDSINDRYDKITSGETVYD